MLVERCAVTEDVKQRDGLGDTENEALPHAESDGVVVPHGDDDNDAHALDVGDRDELVLAHAVGALAAEKVAQPLTETVAHADVVALAVADDEPDDVPVAVTVDEPVAVRLDVDELVAVAVAEREMVPLPDTVAHAVAVALAEPVAEPDAVAVAEPVIVGESVPDGLLEPEKSIRGVYALTLFCHMFAR